jgi:hypothetical protein
MARDFHRGTGIDGGVRVPSNHRTTRARDSGIDSGCSFSLFVKAGFDEPTRFPHKISERRIADLSRIKSVIGDIIDEYATATAA